MYLAIINSRASSGIQALPVVIEVHLSKGLPGLSIVGLPETAVKESRHRVRSAVINSGFEFPTRRITVNLAPADLPKEGGCFDLPIALGILAASGQIPFQSLSGYEIVGELGLSGELRACRGILPLAIAARAVSRSIIIPTVNLEECRFVKQLTAFGASHLTEVCAHLAGSITLSSVLVEHLPPLSNASEPDLAQVQGQPQARRALEIAAAGRHSLLMVGTPGSGKTMLATRLPGLLPPMSEEEALEVATVYSTSKLGFNYQQWQKRPFRAPHHTASGAALVGGSNPPAPGEISLAHHGVLFLDELPEFARTVLENLREPLEAGKVAISRASHQTVYPSLFQLVAAMNPCPCGYFGDGRERCRCSIDQIKRYQQKISGPLLDRIDIHLTVQPLPAKMLIQSSSSNESSAKVRERVSQAHRIQQDRQGKLNVALNSEEILRYCALRLEDQQFLGATVEKLGFSARAYHRILKLARTIADLEKNHLVDRNHLEEAICYRRVLMI